MFIAVCDSDEKVVDDIKSKLEVYKKYNNLPFEIFYYSRGTEILEENECFDVIILDDALPDINSFDLCRSLKERNSNISIIFISDNDLFVDDAFEIGAIRYLNKPVSSQRLFSAIDSAVNRYEQATENIYIKDKSNVFRLYTDEIIYIEIDNRKTRIVTPNGVYSSKRSLKSWREGLKDSCFACPHNSFIINMKYITDYKRNDYVVLNGEYRIEIARNSGNSFNECFYKYHRVS